jgi:SAM-dependent methyltransferase
VPPTDQIRVPRLAGPLPIPAAEPAFPDAPVCPLCGLSETQPAFSDNGCQLRVCNVCDLFFAHPYPADTSQHQCVSSGTNRQIELLDCRRRYQGERLFYERHFGPIAEEISGATSLLDVGCGTGNLLERLATRPNFHRAGIELNAQAARFARRTAGCTVWEMPFEAFHGGRQFDVITLINVLSHIPTFDGLFASLRTALRPGGKVIIRTSEMSRNVSRWNQIHWGIPDDLHFLGLGTLDYLCRKYGFVVARHVRTPFELELFRRSRWEQMGRSKLQNIVKKVLTRVPLALPALKSLYSAVLGRRLFVSFIVLMALPSNGDADRPGATASPGRRTGFDEENARA